MIFIYIYVCVFFIFRNPQKRKWRKCRQWIFIFLIPSCWTPGKVCNENKERRSSFSLLYNFCRCPKGTFLSSCLKKKVKKRKKIKSESFFSWFSLFSWRLQKKITKIQKHLDSLFCWSLKEGNQQNSSWFASFSLLSGSLKKKIKHIQK